MVTREKVVIDNGTFVALVVSAVSAWLGLTAAPMRTVETSSGDLAAKHPVLAFFRFLRSLGNGENKAEREALTAKLKADGATEEAIEKAVKAIKRSRENDRTDVRILRRLHHTASDNGLVPIILTQKMERKLISLLKNSIAYDGNVTSEMLDEVFDKLSEVCTLAENSTVTVQDLGIGAPVPIPAEFIAGKKAKAEQPQPAN